MLDDTGGFPREIADIRMKEGGKVRQLNHAFEDGQRGGFQRGGDLDDVAHERSRAPQFQAQDLLIRDSEPIPQFLLCQPSQLTQKANLGADDLIDVAGGCMTWPSVRWWEFAVASAIGIVVATPRRPSLSGVQ